MLKKIRNKLFGTKYYMWLSPDKSRGCVTTWVIDKSDLVLVKTFEAKSWYEAMDVFNRYQAQ